MGFVLNAKTKIGGISPGLGDRSRNGVKQSAPGPQWNKMARANVFAVLVAVVSCVPKMPETDGAPWPQIPVATIAEITGLSSERVVESLEFLRTWRVLWVRFRFRGETVEVRFQRSVVMWLLGAARVAPKEVGKLLAAHRRKREIINPLPGTRTANRAGNVLPVRM